VKTTGPNNNQLVWEEEEEEVEGGADAPQLSWKCRCFRCHPQLVLTTCLRVFPTRRPDTADVSATSCDVGFIFSVSYAVSLPNCRHVVVVTTTMYHTTSQKCRAKHLGVCRSLKIFAKIDPKDTVDKLNKSKTGNVNVNKMVLPWVSCWWWSCCFC